MKYQIWDKLTPIITPSGEEFSPEEWKEKYKWARLTGVKAVITSGVINGGVMAEYENMKENYIRMGASITSGMTDTEVLAAFENFENRPQEPIVTADDRAAAALELIALSSMPDA